MRNGSHAAAPTTRPKNSLPFMSRVYANALAGHVNAIRRSDESHAGTHSSHPGMGSVRSSDARIRSRNALIPSRDGVNPIPGWDECDRETNECETSPRYKGGPHDSSVRSGYFFAPRALGIERVRRSSLRADQDRANEQQRHALLLRRAESVALHDVRGAPRA